MDNAPLPFPEFLDRVARLRDQIASACAAAGRPPESVRLLPVTKTHGAWAVDYAVRAGLPAVGENRVQEAQAKQPLCATHPRWELIGHLQSNKARPAAEAFDCIQSVDSPKLARLLGNAATALGKRLRILLQINAGHDPAKFGADLDTAPALLEAALACPALDVAGLMTIAPLSDDPAVARRTFANLRQLRDTLQPSHPLPELSMGMSSDLAAAILEGSTTVRIGTALFGPRPSPPPLVPLIP
ncbi:YggS family pyridoxal phosphate-dependent enzyme [Nibricoccus sp. IMCC34717]|uniref:YggS family pyridoxal phosphate-dependent enzyme n=1 Tax=Nibricoccus sp. IMCC34717 TaxID=3034021 RepID=UPI003850C0E5